MVPLAYQKHDGTSDNLVFLMVPLAYQKHDGTSDNLVFLMVPLAYQKHDGTSDNLGRTEKRKTTYSVFFYSTTVRSEPEPMISCRS